DLGCELVELRVVVALPPVAAYSAILRLRRFPAIEFLVARRRLGLRPNVVGTNGAARHERAEQGERCQAARPCPAHAILRPAHRRYHRATYSHPGWLVNKKRLHDLPRLESR